MQHKPLTLGVQSLQLLGSQACVPLHGQIRLSLVTSVSDKKPKKNHITKKTRLK
jgi:hypothetical protein